jgi:hypothetical protein
MSYHLAFAIKLFPGLRHDQLTVLGCPDIYVSYATLNGLIKGGNGWRSLRYTCHSSVTLGYQSGHSFYTIPNWWTQHRFWRRPQPHHWQTVLEGRDGIASNPSFKVYQAEEPRLYGSILDPSNRVTFEQTPNPEQDSRPEVFPADPRLMTGDEQEKELMVVRRGSGANYYEVLAGDAHAGEAHTSKTHVFGADGCETDAKLRGG